MRVVFLSDFRDHKAGSSAVIDEATAWWLISIGAARQHTPGDDTKANVKNKGAVADARSK